MPLGIEGGIALHILHVEVHIAIVIVWVTGLDDETLGNGGDGELIRRIENALPLTQVIDGRRINDSTVGSHQRHLHVADARLGKGITYVFPNLGRSVFLCKRKVGNK